MTDNIPPTPLPLAAPLSESDERTWAMVAHLSVLLNLVTGALGPVVPLIIYFVFKDRSRYVAYHSLQSFLMQLLLWVGGGALVGAAWAGTALLSAIFIGLLCIPIACVITVLPLIALGYGVWAAVETSQGKDFKYWLIGDWVRGTLTG
jgi:hypothetical protein